MIHTRSGILITFVLIIIGALLIGGATVALFTSTAENTRNTFQAGALIIELDRNNGSLYFDLVDIAPGDGGSQPVTIANTGTLDLDYRIAYDLSGVLAQGQHPLQIQFFDSNDLPIDLSLARRLNTGQEETITVIWDMPLEAGNEYQAGTATFELLINAAQVTEQGSSAASHYVFRDLSINGFQTIGPWTETDIGFHAPITHGNLESLLFIPNNRESYTIVSNAILGRGVYNTGTSGGYGIFFETSINEHGNDTGYILQFDRSYLQIHIRQRSNGHERRPMAIVSHAENSLIPTDRNDTWWTESHTIEIQVEPSELNPNKKLVSVRINQVDIFNNIEIDGVNPIDNHTGLRTWYSTATFQDLLVH